MHDNREPWAVDQYKSVICVLSSTRGVPVIKQPCCLICGLVLLPSLLFIVDSREVRVRLGTLNARVDIFTFLVGFHGMIRVVDRERDSERQDHSKEKQ